LARRHYRFSSRTLPPDRSQAGLGSLGMEGPARAKTPATPTQHLGPILSALPPQVQGGANTNTETNFITVNPPGIDQYTKLMLHFNGPNGSRTFTDSENTPKTVTGYGNAQISTAYSEFGGASLKLDGSSYLSVPPSTDWNFSGDFTIDFWWYRTGTAGSDSPIIRTGTGYSLFIEDVGTVSLWISSNGKTWDIASEVKIGTPSGTGFDHYALVRAANTYYTFQNGVLTNSFANPLPPYYIARRILYTLAMMRQATWTSSGYQMELQDGSLILLRQALSTPLDQRPRQPAFRPIGRAVPPRFRFSSPTPPPGPSQAGPGTSGTEAPARHSTPAISTQPPVHTRSASPLQAPAGPIRIRRPATLQ